MKREINNGSEGNAEQPKFKKRKKGEKEMAKKTPVMNKRDKGSQEILQPILKAGCNDGASFGNRLPKKKKEKLAKKSRDLVKAVSESAENSKSKADDNKKEDVQGTKVKKNTKKGKNAKIVQKDEAQQNTSHTEADILKEESIHEILEAENTDENLVENGAKIEVTDSVNKSLPVSGVFDSKKEKSLKKSKKLTEASLQIAESTEKNRNENKKKDGEVTTVNNSVTGRPKKKKKKGSKKSTIESSNSEEHKEKNMNESTEEIGNTDTATDEIIYTLLGNRPEKISTLNDFEKRLVKLSLLKADDIKESKENNTILLEMKQKHQKVFQEAVDRGVEKGFIYHIDSRNSRSIKFDDDSD